MAILGTAGPGSKSPTGPLFRIFLLRASYFPIKTTHTGMSREPLCFGVVKLNLLQFQEANLKQPCMTDACSAFL